MNDRVSFLSIAAVVVWLGGCSGMTTSSPAVVPQVSQGFGRTSSAHRNNVKSWMDPRAVSQKLLYVSDSSTGQIHVYVYPGLTLAGLLTPLGIPAGECTDGGGNVWIADYLNSDVVEFAHGGTTQVNVLSTGYMTGPVSCAIDLKNGDLAVAGDFIPGAMIFHNAEGAGTVLTDPNIDGTRYLGYDNRGNLFVDGTKSGAFAFAELPAGSNTFTDIALDVTPAAPGNVQWDGKYVSVGDLGANIYQTQGSNVVGTTTLSGAGCIRQFYIVPKKTKVIAPDGCNANADVYFYPGGGSPIKTLTGSLHTPFGAVLSQ
jgi:hypothetical protein